MSRPAGNDSQTFSNISANTAQFTLQGGKYGVDCIATFSAGNVTLQKLAGDGATYVTALTAFSAAGYGTADLPCGIYRVAVTTATAVYVTINRIDGE